MKFSRSFSIPVLSLVVGAAFGWCLHDGATPSAAPAADAPSEPAPALIADAGTAQSLEALRSRVRELEARLAEASAPRAADEAAPVAEKSVAKTEGPAFPDPMEMLERMKKDNPERYAQMTNHFEAFRRRWKEQSDRRFAFLESVDVSRFTAEGRETHARLLEALGRREDLAKRIQAPEISFDERREIWGEMRQNEEALRDLSRVERENLLGETAAALGLEGELAGDFVETVKGVFEATNVHGGFGGRGGPGGPGGDAGRGGPRAR